MGLKNKDGTYNVVLEFSQRLSDQLRVAIKHEGNITIATELEFDEEPWRQSSKN